MLEAIGCEDTPENKKRGLNYLKQATHSRHIEAMANLGYYLVCAIGCDDNPENKKLGFEYLQQAAYAGHINAVTNIGSFLVEARGCADTPENKKRGFKYLQQAADSGNIDAIFNIGTCLVGAIGCDDIPANKKLGFEYLQQAAEAGHIEAIFSVGVCLVKAMGCHDTSANKKLGIKYLKQLANNGHSEAIIELAFGYYEGNFVEKDDKTSLEYFIQFDKINKNIKLQVSHLIGRIYFGLGKYKEALEFYLKLIVQGHRVNPVIISLLEKKTTFSKRSTVSAKNKASVGKSIQTGLIRELENRKKELLKRLNVLYANIKKRDKALSEYEQVTLDANTLKLA